MRESKTIGLLHPSISHGHIKFGKGENAPQFDHFGHGSTHGGGEMTIMDGAEMRESKTIGLLHQSISHGHVAFAKEGENAPQFDHFGHGSTRDGSEMSIVDGAEIDRSVAGHFHPSISHGNYAQIGSELRETGQPKKWKPRQKKQEKVPWATLAHLERVRRKPKPEPADSPKKKKKKSKKKKKLADTRPLHERGIRGSTFRSAVIATAAATAMARKPSIATLPSIPRNAGRPHQRHSLAPGNGALHARLVAQKARVQGTVGQPLPMQTYGGGHNDKDLEDHFESGMQMQVSGERSHKEQFGEHYGGTSSTKNDTFSHLAAGALAPAENSGLNDRSLFGGGGAGRGAGAEGGHKGGHQHADHDHIQVGALVPDRGAVLLNHNNAVAPHYGHGHEDMDTFDHFESGTNLGKDGAKSYIENYGEHYGGTDDKHNDTYSHMNLGHGMKPNEQLAKIKPYNKPRHPPQQFKLTGSGYMSHLTKPHPTYPQDTSGTRGTMVYPGKVVVRPETLDTGKYDHRYTDSDAVHAARRDAPLEQQDGLLVSWPGYRAAKPAQSYEMKFTSRQHRLHEGDQRGGQDQHDLLR